MEQIRIQPEDIDIPEDNPLLNDQLGRQKMVEALTRLVSTIGGSCVIAIDAPWGAGKTTFLKMWSQHLRNEHFPVVEFNAWETDFSEDPFVALCAELSACFETEEGTELSEKMMGAAQKVAKHIASNALSRITVGLVNTRDLLADLQSMPVATDIHKRFDDYKGAQDAIEEFKETLKHLVIALNSSKPEENAGGDTAQGTAVVTEMRHVPLLVMIDELDRCRPSYAVELLETTKHLFSVDQVVFVLAVNRTELQHAVKALYGNEFNAEVYLRRFFDVDLHLPEAKRDRFINGLLDSIGLKDNVWFQRLLMAFFSSTQFTLRDTKQAVQRLGLALKAVPDTHYAIAGMTLVALILRTLDEKLYKQFAEKKTTDIEVANEIFNIPSIAPLRWREEGIWLQTGIWLSYRELMNNYRDTTPLEDLITQRIKGEEDTMTKGAMQHAQSHALGVLQDKDVVAPVFQSAYQHIELFYSFIDGTS